MIELLTNDHFDRILDLFDGAQQRIDIISPFLAKSMAARLCEAVTAKGLTCRFITRLYLEDLIAKANDIEALELMMERGIEVYLVKGLHTKLYLFDCDAAILGSANFTNGGFKSNIELSLLLSGEASVLGELRSYYDDMVAQTVQAGDGRLTKEICADAKARYASLFTQKKSSNVKTYSGKMYGAALDRKTLFDKSEDITKELKECEGEKDLVTSLFQETEQVGQICYPYNIWLKFSGEANNRFASDEPFSVVPFQLPQGLVYLCNYPYKVGSIKDDDEVYLAGLTTDKRGKNQPIIAGRGHLAAFAYSNTVTDAMIAEYPWMVRFPWYCLLKDCEVLNTRIDNGLPMDTIWDALGSDTYLASFGRQESIPEVARKHYQKAHMRLSGNAKQFIDKRFEELKAQYGVIEYISQL